MSRVPGFWHDGRFYPIIAGGDGTDDDGDGATGATDPVVPPAANGATVVTFPNQQALGQRLGRERRTAMKELAEQYGFATFEDMKTSLDADKTRREAQQGEVATLRQQAQAAQVRANEADARIRRMALEHAVEVEAARVGFHDPADAFALADFSQVSIGDDGTIDRAAVKATLDGLATQRPYLVKAGAARNGTTQDAGASAAAAQNTDQPNTGVMINGVPMRTPMPGRTPVVTGKQPAERRTELAARYPTLQRRL